MGEKAKTPSIVWQQEFNTETIDLKTETSRLENTTICGGVIFADTRQKHNLRII